MKKIIVIGAGIAGLSAAIYGKLNGYDVEIYEKNREAGGFLTSWYRKNTLVDGCLHWLIGTKDGTRLNRIWKTIGGLDDVKIYHPNSFYEVKYEGKSLKFYRDIEKLRESLLSVSVNDDELINELIDIIKEMGVMEMPSDVPFELADPNDFKPNMVLLKKMRRYLKITVDEMADLFNSDIIKFAIRNSIVDKEFSAYYFIQTLSNFTSDNASLPVGGSHGLRNRLVNKFEGLGGKIYYNSNVDEIIINDNIASGIKLNNGDIINADYIIPAGDIHYTFEKLLGGKYRMSPYCDIDNDKKKYPTYSFIITTFRTRYDFKDEEIAQVHKVDSYKVCNREFNILSMRHYGYEESFKNDGYTAVQVMLPTYEEDYDYIKALSKEEYKAFKKEVADIYKDRLEKIFGCEFELVDTLTPLTYERYVHSYKGSFMTYALKPKVQQGLRSALVDGIDNLVIANQWLMMPGGTPVAVVSGKLAIQLILYKDGKNYKIN